MQIILYLGKNTESTKDDIIKDIGSDNEIVGTLLDLVDDGLIGEKDDHFYLSDIGKVLYHYIIGVDN
jgi:predicted transcriptional regulator